MIFDYGVVARSESYIKPAQQLALDVLQETYDFHQRELTETAARCTVLEKRMQQELGIMERELKEHQKKRDDHQASKDALEEVMAQIRKHL